MTPAQVAKIMSLVDPVKLYQPKICIIKSEELSNLNDSLQTNFPVVYDLLGGIEGLLMCADKGEISASNICRTDEILYDHLSTEAYNVLETVAETETGMTGNEFVYDQATSEYISWGFTETLLQATKVYGEILRECLRSLMDQHNEINITMLTRTPIRSVYMIQFTNQAYKK